MCLFYFPGPVLVPVHKGIKTHIGEHFFRIDATYWECKFALEVPNGATQPFLNVLELSGSVLRYQRHSTFMRLCPFDFPIRLLAFDGGAWAGAPACRMGIPKQNPIRHHTVFHREEKESYASVQFSIVIPSPLNNQLVWQAPFNTQRSHIFPPFGGTIRMRAE